RTTRRATRARGPASSHAAGAAADASRTARRATPARGFARSDAADAGAAADPGRPTRRAAQTRGPARWGAADAAADCRVECRTAANRGRCDGCGGDLRRRRCGARRAARVWTAVAGLPVLVISQWSRGAARVVDTGRAGNSPLAVAGRGSPR